MTLQLSTPLSEAIVLAERAGACHDALRVLRPLDGPGVTLADLTSHSSAPEWAYWYARDVIGGRWPEAEAVIAASPEWAYWYARDVIGGRWPEAE